MSSQFIRSPMFMAITAILTFALVAAAPAVDMRSGERVEATGELTDLAFIAARDATLAVQSTDDIMVAARTVRIEGASADHLFIAAGAIPAKAASPPAPPSVQNKPIRLKCARSRRR